MDITKCVRPSCPSDQSLLANGTCQNISAILEDLNIGQAPFFQDLPEQVVILVNPLDQDRKYSLSVEDFVDFNNNQPDEVSYSVISGLDETFMTWDEISATISLDELTVEKVGTYTVKVRV